MSSEEWVYYIYPDGTEQWTFRGCANRIFTIERVKRKNSRRKQWAVIERVDDKLYPPKIAGLFKELDAAKAALMVIAAARGF